MWKIETRDCSPVVALIGLPFSLELAPGRFFNPNPFATRVEFRRVNGIFFRTNERAPVKWGYIGVDTEALPHGKRENLEKNISI